MAADDFFSRWSKSKPATDIEPERTALPSTYEGRDRPAAPAEPAPPPTLDEVAKLNHESDFSRFVGRDVDDAVKRSALKKLFSNPHFNVMDGLDIYIDDYNKFTPLTPAVLATLNHAKDLLNPKGRQREAPLSRQEEDDLLSSCAAADDEGGADDRQQTNSAEDDAGMLQHDKPAPDTSGDSKACSDDVDDKPTSQGGT